MSRPWWIQDAGDLYDAAWAVVNYLQKEQDNRRTTLLRNMRLYGGTQVEGYGPYTYSRLPSQPFRASDRLTLNVVGSNIDTITSKMAKNQPRPRFLTIDGNFTEQRKAKNLQRFIDGQFYRLDAYKLGISQFLDCCWAGTGFTYWYRRDGEIHAERVFPGEIMVDLREAIYGNPRQLFRVKYVDRGLLHGLYPDKWDTILSDTSPAETTEFSGSTFDYVRDQIKVIECWHLPSYEGAGDGKYAVIVENGTLEDSEWTRDNFPFVKLTWKSPLLGYFGQGITDELTGIQIEINKLLRKIQDAFHLLAVPWVLLENGSRINPQKIANNPGLILNYSGTPPQVVAFKTVNPEVFQHLDSLVARSYEITGISQLSATSLKPAGLNSGRALQEYNDIESERFMATGRDYERMFLKYTEQIVILAKEIDADPKAKHSEVMGIGNKSVIPLKWKDVCLKDDSYVMQVWPSSSLPTHPAAKQERVLELLSSQLIDPAQATKLMDFPDTEAYNSLRDAPIDDIEAQIEELLEGKYEPPEPFQDLDRAMVMVRSAYLLARRQGASEEVLDGMRRYLAEVTRLKERILLEQTTQQQEMEAQAAAANAARTVAQASPTQGQAPVDIAELAPGGPPIAAVPG